MKLIKKSIFILFGIFLYLSPIVAQTNLSSSPTDFGTTGETATNPNDSQAAPIDNCLILLLILGLSFAFLTLNNFTKINKVVLSQNNFKNNKSISSTIKLE